MAHHGTHPFQNIGAEEWAEKLGLGATNKFPEGKIDEHDEGEIKIGITEKDGTVVLAFGKNINWIGFTKEQAKQIAFSLLSKSDWSFFGNMKKWLDAYEKDHPEQPEFSANSIMNWIHSQPSTT